MTGRRLLLRLVIILVLSFSVGWLISELIPWPASVWVVSAATVAYAVWGIRWSRRMQRDIKRDTAVAQMELHMAEEDDG